MVLLHNFSYCKVLLKFPVENIFYIFYLNEKKEEKCTITLVVRKKLSVPTL